MMTGTGTLTKGISMEFRRPRSRGTQPETKVRDAIRRKLEYHGWFVKVIHGSKFQHGLPDLFVSHVRYGQKWVEVKVPGRINLQFGGVSDHQRKCFKQMEIHGVPIYILTGADETHLLAGKPNWRSYTYNRHARKLPKGL